VAVTELRVEVKASSTELRSSAEEAASANGVPDHEVLVRLLLALPREASEDGLVDTQIVAAEAHTLAARLSARTAPYVGWTRTPAAVLRASELEFAVAEDTIARPILERFHYLESFRMDGKHFGGSIGTRLAALMTVSPLDVPPIAEHLPEGVDASEVAVLSRVFAFEWAPRNSISFLIARLVRALRRRADGPRLLLTYVNPNVGFSGASYRASNWSLWAREIGTRYAYLDDRYITDRALARRFGTADEDDLRERLGPRVAFSRMRLDPLDLYAYPIDTRLRSRLESSVTRELLRP
jgi:hypothetical protein